MKNQKGSASVLVICVLLILVTLGALAIASANANHRLSQRSLAWNTVYYELDAQGEVFLAALDGKLAAAEKMTADYLQSNLTEMDQRGAKNIAQLYWLYADEYINELALDYPALTRPAEDNGSGSETGYIEMSFTYESGLLYHLSVSVAVEPPAFTVSEPDGVLSAERANGPVRYKIEKWYIYQEDIPTEQEITLWDGDL